MLIFTKNIKGLIPEREDFLLIMIDPRLHTAEHILWQVLKNRLRFLKTRALEFKREYCRFDFTADKKLTEREIQEITENVNEIISKNLEVSFEMMPREKVKGIVDLSLVPEGIESIRIVKIGNFSLEACVGPHVKNTSEIGKIQIIEYKKVGKDTFRIKFGLK